ncbi:DeoR/GlpR family DNA-binding transcription regulator [Kitasatospora sp. SUK 42]|uniref:DeoR/GlpR family DNA-binding transcription regulator n=1 Tax=Kitasatospora sp. SUK 42 TaxID=1588882 RepID=UPI0018CAA4CD|nr:DeoR/GlpR family DNA-binding transcription regulator [Kitasatospora sp. SUK 42]MBV2155149.1 DeoR/GlpR family DNA-binding transcription regulator [Kitasatospora sp. SUK 42]
MADSAQPLAGQRRVLILEQVRARGGVRVTELVRDLGVSDMTIRRDLDALARRGLVQKVHGGAVRTDAPATGEPGFETKAGWELPAKEAIARAAAALVQPGAAVGLAGGTTPYAVARHLHAVEGLTVVTNSLRIAELLEQPHEDGTPATTTVIRTGGVRTPSDTLVGPVADQALRSLHVNVLILGCHGLSDATGLTTPNLAEAETNRTFIRSARRVVVVADHTKWGAVGLASFAQLDQVDVLVTDEELPEEQREAAARLVGELIIAPAAD